MPRCTYYGAANAKDADVSRSEVMSQSASLVHVFSDSLSFRDGFRHYKYTLDRHNTHVTAANNAAGTVTLSHGGILRDEDGWSNQAELTQKLDLAGTHHTILYGWEQSRQVKGADTVASRVVAVTSAFAPVNPVINPGSFTALSASNINRFTTTGFYVQDLVDLGHGIKAFILRRTGIKGTDPVTQRVTPIGTQRTRGAELSATLDLPSGFRAIAGYSYLDSKVTASATPTFVDKGATLTPKNQANLFVTKNLFSHYGIGGGCNYVTNRWADPTNTTILPHYVTADVMGWAEFGPVRLQLDVYNISDKRYIISGHGTSPLLNLPGAPSWARRGLAPKSYLPQEGGRWPGRNEALVDG